ncbi:restriction endonuclease subunit S, partial [Helicobacter sp. 10-6591]|uniref:restriction endonuclease subunit S n=1 Tax=Helicobacter sp. 10-6591 TaxID=2004998 RepID=UPI000DCB8DFD
DKIELNNSINNNLEQQAQAIFKSWFVDFEPFGGVMPDDWMYKELGDLGLDISDGNYSSKYPKTNEFVNTGVAFIRGTDFIGTSISKQNMYYITEKKHKELLKGHTKKDDLLITTRGEIGRIAFVPDSLIDVNINSQLVRINGNKILPKSYLACSLLSTKVQNDFKSLITGSALQQLPIGRLKKIILLKPSTEILNHFDKIVGNLLKVSDQNYEENEHLTQLRDTLLPKLMSGEIDVSKVEINEILEGSSDDKLSFSEK